MAWALKFPGCVRLELDTRVSADWSKHSTPQFHMLCLSEWPDSDTSLQGVAPNSYTDLIYPHSSGV